MLSQSQILKAALYGLVIWFAAAIVIKIGRPLGAFDGMIGVATYLLAVPVSVAFVPIGARIAGLDNRQILSGTTVSVVVAVLSDGIGLNWGSALYGGPGVSLAPAAGWLLWAVGISLAYAFWKTQQALKTT